MSFGFTAHFLSLERSTNTTKRSPSDVTNCSTAFVLSSPLSLSLSFPFSFPLETYTSRRFPTAVSLSPYFRAFTTSILPISPHCLARNSKPTRAFLELNTLLSQFAPQVLVGFTWASSTKVTRGALFSCQVGFHMG